MSWLGNTGLGLIIFLALIVGIAHFRDVFKDMYVGARKDLLEEYKVYKVAKRSSEVNAEQFQRMRTWSHNNTDYDLKNRLEGE